MKIEKKYELVKGKVEEIFQILEIPKDENSEETPHRIAKMWAKEVFSSLFANREEFMEDMKTFPAPKDTTGNFISVKDIPFTSMCAHHWLPFIGKVSVTYLPNEKVIGLSKIPRIVKFCSRKPQLQENLTEEIGKMVIEAVNPKHVRVKIYDTIHTCVLARGAESEANTETVWEWWNRETESKG